MTKLNLEEKHGWETWSLICQLRNEQRLTCQTWHEHDNQNRMWNYVCFKCVLSCQCALSLSQFVWVSTSAGSTSAGLYLRVSSWIYTCWSSSAIFHICWIFSRWTVFIWSFQHLLTWIAVQSTTNYCHKTMTTIGWLSQNKANKFIIWYHIILPGTTIRYQTQVPHRLVPHHIHLLIFNLYQLQPN